MKRDPLQYVDRETGQLKSDRIYASGFLEWCYNTRAGWLVTRQLLSRPFVSRIYGRYYKCPWTHRKITSFVQALEIDTSNCLQPLSSFCSFNDFIIRRIDPASRPIDPGEETCISPVDGRVWVQAVVTRGQRFPIKSATFELDSFLGDTSLAAAYDGGTLCVFRLYLGDYHHFHFPDAGIPLESRSLPGRYYAVTPYARHWTVPWCATNRRHLTLFESRHFGRIAQVEVGAFTVGSIRQCVEPGVCVTKGAHKGYFELGGSIVALLFSPGRIRLDADLLANSARGLETYVKMGRSIGHR